MRCPDCSKFVSLEMQDPEVELLEVSSVDDAGVTIAAQVRIVRACADCGTELKEATLDDKITVPWNEFFANDFFAGEKKLVPADVATLNVEVTAVAIEQHEEGGGRYAKSYFGANVQFNITVNQNEAEAHSSMIIKCAASEMDEMV